MELLSNPLRRVGYGDQCLAVTGVPFRSKSTVMTRTATCIKIIWDACRCRFDQDNNLVSETTVTLGAPGSDVHLSGLSEDERTSLLADNCGTPSSSSVVPNAVTAGRLVIGTGRLYESKNRGDTIEDITPEGMSTIREARAIASGARSGETALPEVLYVTTGLVRGEMIGIESQLWLRRPEGGPLSQLTYPAEAVVAKDVALDPQDWRNIYFVDANGRVWHTSDATATPLVWNELTADRDATGGGLPTDQDHRGRNDSQGSTGSVGRWRRWCLPSQSFCDGPKLDELDCIGAAYPMRSR